MLRKIIQIDENKCDGCGECVPECHEGALQIIDGKARLISDLFCDGLGACLGHCPTDALTIVEREAESYNESKVMEYIVKGGTNVIKAHLKHLRDHEEFEYIREALEYLRDHNIENPILEDSSDERKVQCGCPGSKEIFIEESESGTKETGNRISHLRQWPIQLHLVSPNAQYFRNANLLLAADCCGFAYPDFHKDFLKGKSLAIACPKLDSNKQIYFNKLLTMIDESNINSITVLIMQVPCCSGLVQLALNAVNSANKKISINYIVLGINGEIIQEEKVA